jgi:flagellar motor switch protein FliG
LSDLVEFEDLSLLDGADLRSVLGQVTAEQVLEALAGTSPSLRQRLLAKLPAAVAARIEADVAAHGPVAFEAVQSAQRALVDALCRLSRGGHIAFDDPEDMVA